MDTHGRIKAEDVPAPRRIAAFAFFMVADFFYGWSWNTADVLRPDIRAALDLTLTQAGSMYSAQGLGAWGAISDRFGRKVNALGFGLGAATVALYVTLADTVPLLMLLGAAYGFMIAASVIWGPWIAELYPPHLRSTAASIFNWGRIISFFAPLVTGSVAEAYGLNAAMGLAAIAFGLATLVWLTLPETVHRKHSATAKV